MAFSVGDGTELNPYQVGTPSELNEVRDYPTAYFIQVADIDLSTYGSWTPIMDPVNVYNGFSGSYDGQNHTITGLTIDNVTHDEIGLFAMLRGGRVKNLNITNAVINIPTAGIYSVGILTGLIADSRVGLDYNEVTNCRVSGSITSLEAMNDIGGLVGRVSTESAYLMLNTSDVDISIASGDSNTNRNVGGFIGECESEYVYTVSTGPIDNRPTTGEPHNAIEIYKCSSLGSITIHSKDSIYDVGGFIGGAEGVTVKECHSVTPISIICEEGFVDFDSISGFISSLNGSIIENCYSINDISVTNDLPSGSEEYLNVAGFCGFDSGNTFYKNNYTLGEYSLPSTLTTGGGFARAVSAAGASSTIEGCYYAADQHPVVTPPGTPKTLQELKTQTTFESWDFDTVWGIDSGINESFPYLLSDPPQTTTTTTDSQTTTTTTTEPQTTTTTTESFLPPVIPLKEIKFSLNILSTKPVPNFINQRVYTNDNGSVKIVYTLLDCTPENLMGASAKIITKNRRSKVSLNASINGNKVSRVLTSAELDTLGLLSVQLELKVASRQTYASPIFTFEVDSEL